MTQNQQQEEKTPWWVNFLLIVIIASAIIFLWWLPFRFWEYVLYVVLAGLISYFLTSRAYSSQGDIEGGFSVGIATFLGAFSPLMLLFNIGLFIEHLVLDRKR